MKSFKLKFLFTISFIIYAIASNAQILISAGSTLGQNFSIGTSATASLPAPWKIDKKDSVRTVGTYTTAVSQTEKRGGNNMGFTSSDGIYNFGAGNASSASDRAVGWLSSTGVTESGNLYTFIKNNGTDSIYNFTISYDVEKYKKGSNSSGFTIQMYYSTNGTTWTLAGTDFKTTFAGGGLDNGGYSSAPGVTVNVSNKTLGVQLNAGDSLYLAWNYSVTTGSNTSFAQALGIDNFTITANPFPPAFDATITEWVLPTSNCNLSSSEPVTIKVKNLGVDTITTFSVKYSINNGVTYSTPETYFGQVLPGGEITRTFTAHANFSTINTYHCIAVVYLATDPNHSNDTIRTTVVSVPTVNSFPYFENFESNQGWSSEGNVWQYGIPSKPGISSAKSGMKAWLTGLSANYPNNTVQYLYSPCFDFTTLTAPLFSSWIYLNIPDIGNDAMILESSINHGLTWQKVNGNANFYNYTGAQGTLPSPKWSGNSNGWVYFETPLTGLAGQGSVRFRFRFESNATVNGEGIAIDDITIRNPFSIDLAVVGWVSPMSSCGLSDTSSITVSVANVGSNAITQFPISYSLDNGVTYIPNETFNGNLPAGDTINYTFTTHANLSQPENYSIVVKVSLSGDLNTVNDKLIMPITSLPYVTTFPYLQDNEMSFTGWVSGSLSGPNQWEIGAPNQTALNDAFSGNKAWMTRLSYNYNNSVVSYLLSPCFNFTNLTDPFFSSMLNIRTEPGYDAMILEKSTDGGQTWSKVAGDQGFYNNNSNLGTVAPPKWSDNNGGWQKYQTSLASLAGQPNVRFRFLFTSNNNNNDEGIAIDDMIVRDKYENDLTIVGWVGPVGGCGMSATSTVSVKVANLGRNSQTGFSVGYALNGGTFTFETYTNTINPGDTEVFTFNTTADFSLPMNYGCMAIVNLAGDQNTVNDAYYTTITSIPYITTYPYFQNFEMGSAGWSSDAISGNNEWEFGTCNQTVINFPHSGMAAWMTGLDHDYDNNSNSYLISPCLNFSSLVNPQISVWLNMKISDEGNDAMILERSIDGGISWTKVTGGTLYNYADSIGSLASPKWSGSTNGWTEFKAPLTGLAGQTNVKLRFRFVSNDNNVDEGIAIDDITIHDPFTNDISVVQWVSPISECNMTANEAVTIRIANLGTVPQSNFGLVYSTDGGMTFTPSQNFTSVINPGDSANFTFSTHADFSTPYVYNCIAWSNLANDQNTSNDIQYAKVYAVPTYNTFPYTEDYETFYSGWTSKAIAGVDQWAHGTPNKMVLSYAHGGADAWITKLNTNYNNSSNAVLMSPCLNMQSLSHVEISTWLNIKSEPGYDAVILEKSTNGGTTWSKLDGDPGFYNNTSSNGPINNPPKWSGNSEGWTNYKTSVPSLVNQNDVRLRFRFASDATGNDEGVAIDDFMVYQPINNDLGVTAVLSPVSSICGNVSDSIFIEVTNFGYSTQTQVPVKVEILYPGNNMVIKNKTLNTNLITGQTAVFFIDTLSTTVSGTYFVFASTELASDTINSFNNMTTSSFDVKLPLTIPYVENFESSNTEWTGDITIDQLHGAPTEVMFATLSSTNNNLEASSTKIGPMTPLTRVKFDYRIVTPSGNAYTMQNGDALQIFVSNDCMQNSYMLYEVNNGNHTPATEFQNLEFDLSAFNGSNIFLNYKFISGGQSFFVDIDNIVVADAPVVELGNDISKCTGTVLLNAATAPQDSLYSWRELSLPDIISTASTLLVTASGYYHVTVDNGFGMTAEDSVQVFINALPVFDLGPDIHVCSGTTVNIIASGGTSYHWSNNANTPSITVTPLTVSNYSVTVTDNNGCSATDDINIVTKPLPVVNLGANQMLCGNEVTILNAGSNFLNYLWSTGATTQYITVDSSGIGYASHTYSVTVTGTNNCIGSGSVTITFETCINTGNLSSNALFDIYPNPSNGIFNLVASGMANNNLQIYIYNLQAKLVKSYSLENIHSNFSKQLDLKYLSKGIYYVKMINSNNVFVKKIVIQ